MIFDSHMHVGDFPLFNVSLDRDGLAALMQETGIDQALLFSPDNELVRQIAEDLPGRVGALLGQPEPPRGIRRGARLPRASALPRHQVPPAARLLPPERPVRAPLHAAGRRPRPARALPHGPPDLHAAVVDRGGRRELSGHEGRLRSHGARQRRLHQRVDRHRLPAAERLPRDVGHADAHEDPRGGRAGRAGARAVRLGRAVPPPGGRAAEGAAERPRGRRRRARAGRQRAPSSTCSPDARA